MEWAELVKMYIEIGVLGLCAILVIVMVWLNFKRTNKKDDEKDNKLDKRNDNLEKKFNEMLQLMQQQNQDYQEQQTKNTELLIQSIINGVTNHVPSPEENSKLTKISEEIDKQLQQLLIQTNASRANLVQYHNGGKGINRQSFLKMSMTNEQVQLGVKPFIQDFKDQFRNVLAYFTKQLSATGICYIPNLECIQSEDSSMYEFLKERGIQAKFGLAIHDCNNCVIGFICLEFEDKTKADVDLIDKSLKSKQPIFETLLNL